MELTEEQKRCSYCHWDGDRNGIEYYSGQLVDEEKINQLSGEDGGSFAYLHRCVYGVVLVTNESDNEFYSREQIETPIKYCPWCGRKL